MAENNSMFPENFDFGYDPTKDETIPVKTLITEAALPPSYQVNSAFLPPVGAQGQSPSCCSWAFVYGLTTFWAASNGNGDPSSTDNQASPSYIYIKVMQADGEAENNCKGSSFSTYYPIMQSDGGTPNMTNAPFTDGSPMGSEECSYLWGQYENGTPTIDSNFNIPDPVAVSTTNISDLKQVLSMGYAVAYGTRLYTDFGDYRGNNLPVPYVGNGIIQHNKKTGNVAGHCMLVIGYDDNCGDNGAVLIQNSWTTEWGQSGLVWMDYNTFTDLAQGKGFYFE